MARVTGVVSLYIRNFSKMGGDINLISPISFIILVGRRTCHGMSLRDGVHFSVDWMGRALDERFLTLGLFFF